MTEMNYLQRHNMHCFINGKSCITQLLEFLDVTQAINNNDDMSVIYLDFSLRKHAYSNI